MARVLIVGGGPAGISAACRLAQAGVETVLIERAPRLGGRAASFYYRKRREEIDYGVHVLMRTCRETINLFALLGVRDAVSFQKHLFVPIRYANGKSAVYSVPLPGVLHLLPSLVHYRPLRVRERFGVARTGLSLLLKEPESDKTFADWLSCHHQSPQAVARLWDPIAVATLNARPHDISARAARFVLRNGFFQPHGADLGLFTRPLSAIFGAAIPFLEERGSKVLPNKRAKEVLIEHGKAVGVRLSDGETIYGGTVILAVSHSRVLSLLPAELRADPSFVRVQKLLDSPIVDVHLWFNRAVMEEDFFVGLDSPVQAVFNVSRIQGRVGPTHIILSQSAANDLMPLENKEIVSKLLFALGRLLPKINEARLIDSLVVRYPQATFVPSPEAEQLRPTERTPIPGLYLAGDYTATGWPATIEGAVQSGKRAAEVILTNRQ